MILNLSTIIIFNLHVSDDYLIYNITHVYVVLAHSILVYYN